MNRKFIENSNIILRRILHSNDCLDIIKDFIETFLKIKIKSIKINDTPIIDGEKTKEYGIVDVRAVTEENNKINVGIQIIDGEYIQNKMFLYYAKIHSNQVFYNDNRSIAQTITINILDTAYFSSQQYDRVIKIKSNIINDSILETMELHVLELPKYIKESDKDISNIDAWIMYLKGTSKDEIELAKEYNPQIKKLDSLLRKYWEEELI